MTAETRDQLVADLVQEEGEVLHVYKDSLGFLTLGVGRLVDKRKGGGITKEESRFLLHNDIERVLIEMSHLFPWALEMTETRQRVLAEMLFQLGAKTLLDFKQTLGAMKTGRYLTAARGMRRSKWSTHSTARAERLAKLMEQG
jgi:lysozyme